MKKQLSFKMSVPVNTCVDVDTEIDVDVVDLMGNLDDEEIEEYYEQRFGAKETEYDIKEMTDAYFHGSLDLSKLFKKLGKKVVLEILEEI